MFDQFTVWASKSLCVCVWLRNTWCCDTLWVDFFSFFQVLPGKPGSFHPCRCLWCVLPHVQTPCLPDWQRLLWVHKTKKRYDTGHQSCSGGNQEKVSQPRSGRIKGWTQSVSAPSSCRGQGVLPLIPALLTGVLLKLHWLGEIQHKKRERPYLEIVWFRSSTFSTNCFGDILKIFGNDGGPSFLPTGCVLYPIIIPKGVDEPRFDGGQLTHLFAVAASAPQSRQLQCFLNASETGVLFFFFCTHRCAKLLSQTVSKLCRTLDLVIKKQLDLYAEVIVVQLFKGRSRSTSIQDDLTSSIWRTM